MIDAEKDNATGSGSGSVVRGATMADLDALVGIELRAFGYLHGDPAPPETMQRLRATFAARIQLFGSWLRVLDDADIGPVGMLICCPTSLDEDALAELDSTDDAYRAAFDENATRAFLANFAVAPPRPSSGTALDIVLDAARLLRAHGIREVYFRSMLPGFADWLAQHHPDVDPATLSPRSLAELTEQYWRPSTSQGGPTRPIDPLLRMYVDLGAETLRLIKVPGWGVYSVLCRLTPRRVPCQNSMNG